MSLEAISHLTELRSLDISKSKSSESLIITENGISHIMALTRLEWLNLSYNVRISDNAVKKIAAALTNLTHLSLQCCSRVTDEGMEGVRSLSLVTLDITGCTGVTESGVKKLMHHS